GFIYNRFGRRYEHVRGYEYRGPNYLVQGTCADMMKIALCRAAHGLAERGLKSCLLSTIHDEIMLNVYPDEQEEVIDLLKRSMTEWPELNMTVPMVVEVSVSTTNWGEKVKVAL